MYFFIPKQPYHQMIFVLDGYIKTAMVAIDYDTLKRKPRPPMHVQSKHPDSDQEVYDDVGDQDSISRYVTNL